MLAYIPEGSNSRLNENEGRIKINCLGVLPHLPRLNLNLSNSKIHMKKVITQSPPRQVKFPQILQSALSRLEYLIDSPLLLRGRSRHIKAMYPARREAIEVLLRVMIQHACLAFDGAVLAIGKSGQARPLVVSEMARMAGIGEKRAKRAFADMRELGLISSSQQIRRQGPAGLEVSPVLRQLTSLFWKALSLWSQFVEAVKYSAKNTKLRIILPFKNIVSSIKGARNKLFLLMSQCQARYGPQCKGGHNSLAACLLCKSLR